MKNELAKYDMSRSGRLDRKTFSRALKQLSLALTDEEIDSLFQTAELRDYPNTMDVKTFLDRVHEARNAKPLPTFLGSHPKT